MKRRKRERLIAQWGARIKARIQAGRSLEALAREMTDAGLATHEIKAAFADAAERARYARKKKDIRHGLIWLALGVVVTLVSYGAGVEGGTYVVGCGAIGVGLLRLIRGYRTRTRFDRDPELDDDWSEDENADEQDEEPETEDSEEDAGDEGAGDEKTATK